MVLINQDVPENKLYVQNVKVLPDLYDKKYNFKNLIKN